MPEAPPPPNAAGPHPDGESVTWAAGARTVEGWAAPGVPPPPDDEPSGYGRLPYGQQPGYGQAPYGQQSGYGQPPAHQPGYPGRPGYGPPSAYGPQSAYGRPPAYGPPSGYGRPPWPTPPTTTGWVPGPAPAGRDRSLMLVLVAFGLTALLAVGVSVVALVGGDLLAGVRPGAGVTHGSGAQSPPSGPAAVDSAAERRVAAIQATLSAMTDGLRAHDEAKFLSAVDPARSAVVTRERGVFRALTALPLQEPEYAWSGDELEDAVAPAPAGAVNVVVEFRYRLRGWDTTTAHDPLTLTFAPSGERWLVVGDTIETKGLPAGPFAEPWAAGRMIVEQRPHVIVLGDASHRADVRRTATNLEKVIGDVRKMWPGPTWNGKVIAYASTDRRFVAEWFGDQAADGRKDDPSGDPSFEARVVSLPGEVKDGERQKGPTRLVVTPYLLRQTDTYATSVLRHEVTHVATDRLGRYPPAWLLEGAAEYTGFRIGGTRVDAERTFGRHGVPAATAKAMQRGTWKPLLVNDSRVFYQGTSKAVEAAYIDGWIASLYVADTYGDATLRRLYEVAASQPETSSWSEVDAVALRTVLKTDHAAFTASVRTYGITLRKKFA